jgi:type 1 glutamine amidotransferase
MMTMTRRTISFALAATLLVLLATLAFTLPAGAADGPRKIKVLLVTGDDVGVHPWPAVSQAIKEILLSSGKFDVRVCEDPGVLESAASLARYDLLFLDFYNNSLPTLSPAAKENLLNFVSGGKGFALAHLSSAAFKEWPEYHKLCGRYWLFHTSGHGPRGVFKAHVVQKDNPITRGLDDFQTDDELYGKLQGDGPINVLVEADSDWSKKTEPLVFTLDYGAGRVFHETFGHDAKALQTPAVRTLIQRGCEWAATGKVE